jgi:hypothetical protein
MDSGRRLLKKAQAETFWTIKNAILALIVLAVVIGVFFLLIRGPLKTIFNIGEETSESGNPIIIKLINFFGGCEQEGEQRCSFSKNVECQEGKWVVIGEC